MSRSEAAVVTIKVPFAVSKRGGRKLVLAPDGAPVPPTAPHVDSTLVKAIARAFRWRKMLENGRYATIKEIAKVEKINASYVSRVLRLTLLAPATVEAILGGRSADVPTLAEAMGVFPVEWALQKTVGFRIAKTRMRSRVPLSSSQPSPKTSPTDLQQRQHHMQKYKQQYNFREFNIRTENKSHRLGGCTWPPSLSQDK